MPDKDDWRALNRANWDERVSYHLTAPLYETASLEQGKARLDAIEERELGAVAGLRVLHLQCHFGRDSLILAQRGAEVVGLDFSAPAIAAARELASRLGLESRARFIESDLYAAPETLPEPASFDRVFVTWGAICWLPDIEGWARIGAHFLKAGGKLYLADGHPAAMIFDDERRGPDGLPGLTYPYWHEGPLAFDDASDYADDTARLANSRTNEWIHPLGRIVTSLLGAGCRLDFLHEHPALPWRMFSALVQGQDGLWRWPDRHWLPLSFSLMMTKA